MMHVPQCSAVLFTTVKRWAQSKCPSTDDGSRGCKIHTHMNTTQPLKKEWNNAICSNTDGPTDYRIKWRKSEREREVSYDTTYMWNLKYDINELMHKTETDLET